MGGSGNYGRRPEVFSRTGSSKYMTELKISEAIMSEDQGTVRAVLSGESEQYRRLVEKYQNAVTAAIARIIGVRPEVEDLAQETFWQAYRALGRFRGESRFSTWLLRIAVNKAIDYCRRRTEESMPLEDCERRLLRYHDDHFVPERALLVKEEKEQVHCCLARLPSHYRQVLLRHYIDGYTYREISRETGAPLKTVESRIYRARKALRLLWRQREERDSH